MHEKSGRVSGLGRRQRRLLHQGMPYLLLLGTLILLPLTLGAIGCNGGTPTDVVVTLDFAAPPDDLGWNILYCPGTRLTWDRVRRYPVTIRLSQGATTDFLARFQVRAVRVGGSDHYVIGQFTADFDSGSNEPIIITGVDGGANRIPQDAQELREAFWLGCTNEGEIRGNAGQGPVLSADVYVTLHEVPSRGGSIILGGQTISHAQGGQRIQCVRDPACPPPAPDACPPRQICCEPLGEGCLICISPGAGERCP